MRESKVAWPSGKARVCKTFYGGSIPPATSSILIRQLNVRERSVCLYTPLLFFVLSAYQTWPTVKIINTCLLIILGFASANKGMAQDIKSEEKSLLVKFQRIDYWSSQGNPDSLQAANDAFSKSLADLASTNSISLSYDFPLLRKSNLFIATSSDKKFRIYSWDTWTGGSMHIFRDVWQWMGNLHVDAFGEGPDTSEVSSSSPLCGSILTVLTPRDTFYIAVNTYINSTKDCYERLQGYAIHQQSLDDTAHIFKTHTGLKDGIGYEYDFFSVVDRPERPIILAKYDSLNKVLSIPVILKNGTVTDRWIRYSWIGKYFERVTPP